MRGLRLDYQTGNRPLVIQEAATPQYSYGFFSAQTATGGPVPPAGKHFSPISTTGWQAQLRKGGLFITIRTPNRSLAIATAHALVPTP